MMTWYMRSYEMIEFMRNYFKSEDERGSITGLVNIGTWQEINLVRSDAGVTRGNHFHQTTREGFAILQGRIEVSLQKITDERVEGEEKICNVSAGDVFIIESGVNHIFRVKENAIWINFLDNRMDEKNPDIHRPKA